MNEDEGNETIRAELGDSLYLNHFIDALSDLTWAYNAIYYFLDVSQDIEQTARAWRRSEPFWPPGLPFIFGLPFKAKSRAPAPAELVSPDQAELARYVYPSDRLIVEGCHIASPGWIDLIGKLNPLEVLRQWAHDRHERLKDTKYRDAEDKRKRQLENDLLETELIRKRLELLREVGVPKTVIKKLAAAVLLPVHQVEGHMNNGILTNLTLPPKQHPRIESKQ